MKTIRLASARFRALLSREYLRFRLLYLAGATAPRHQGGSIALLVAILGVVLLGFTALVIDGGLLYLHRRQLQNAADAAALAAAREIINNPAGASGVATTYAASNDVSPGEVSAVNLLSTFNPSDSVEVVLSRQVNLLFAPVINRRSATVQARAVGVVTNIRPYDIWPWGVTQDSYNPLDPQPQRLKVGSRNSMKGNFMAIRFPGYSGAHDYEEFIKYGYNGAVPVEVPPGTWTVETETGNISGPTQQGVSFLTDQPACTEWPPVISCPRYGLVPILSAGTWDEVHGSSEVTVVGFGVFYLLGIETTKDQGGAGQKEVIGQWVQNLVVGVSPTYRLGRPLSGLVGIRLWR